VKGQLVWDNAEKTVLRQVYAANFTANDILEMARATYDLLADVPHTVHLLLELSHLSRNGQMSFMDAAKDLDATVASNQGYVIVIGGGLGMQYTAKTMELSAPKAAEKTHFAETLDEARQLLRRLISK
jgi:hypothetical protein